MYILWGIYETRQKHLDIFNKKIQDCVKEFGEEDEERVSICSIPAFEEVVAATQSSVSHFFTTSTYMYLIWVRFIFSRKSTCAASTRRYHDVGRNGSKYSASEDMTYQKYPQGRVEFQQNLFAFCILMLLHEDTS